MTLCKRAGTSCPYIYTYDPRQWEPTAFFKSWSAGFSKLDPRPAARLQNVAKHHHALPMQSYYRTMYQPPAAACKPVAVSFFA